MSAALKMYRIAVTNMRTTETLAFLGQGTTVAEAVSDGVKNLSAPFRPKQDGRTVELPKVSVRNADGATMLMTLAEFESRETTQPAPASDAVEMEFA